MAKHVDNYFIQKRYFILSSMIEMLPLLNCHEIEQMIFNVLDYLIAFLKIIPLHELMTLISLIQLNNDLEGGCVPAEGILSPKRSAKVEKKVPFII